MKKEAKELRELALESEMERTELLREKVKKDFCDNVDRMCKEAFLSGRKNALVEIMPHTNAYKKQQKLTNES